MRCDDLLTRKLVQANARIAEGPVRPTLNFDNFKTEQLVAMGRLTERDVEELLRQRGITTVNIDRSASAESLQRDIFHLGQTNSSLR